jgi:sugar phosphate isomerase/epimerase
MDATSFPPFPTWTRVTPFRVGLTSYIIPADILPNAEALAGKIQDIELVFFESPEFSNLPDPAVIQRLADLAGIHDLTYTVHFPIDKKLGSPDPRERRAYLEQALRIVELCRTLNPFAYLLHLEGINGTATPGRIRQWQEDLVPVLDEFATQVDPRRVCIENLDYPFEWCDPLLTLHPWSVCLDAGHFWLRNDPWADYLQKYLPRTRVVHLYGIDPPSTAHVGLHNEPVDRVRAFLSALDGFKGVLTLETFGYDDARLSLERLAECLNPNP